MMSAPLRKLALVTHVVSSVGWLGAVGAFLALAVSGLANSDTPVVRAAYVSARTITWSVIVPFSCAALVTGVIQGLGTPWGVFRHYWVVMKLGLTVVASLLLLLHTRAIEHAALAAEAGTITEIGFRRLRIQLVADAALAVAALLGATVLSIYKPQGMTPYGFRHSRQRPGED